MFARLALKLRTPQERLFWTLRLASSLCFIGHGMLGFVAQPSWLPYFQIFGIPDSAALQVMPWVGILDVLVGVLVLLAPSRAVLLYLVVWAIFTSALRPMAGMGWWGLFERARNFGPPLLLMLAAWSAPGGRWFGRVALPSPDAKLSGRLLTLFRLMIALFLVGHAGPALAQGAAAGSLHLRGALELALATAVMLAPVRRGTYGAFIGLCLAVAFTRLAVELPGIASPLMYAIEFRRGGMYLLPIALIFLVEHLRNADVREEATEPVPSPSS